MHSRVCVYPRGSPTRLREIFFTGTCLSNTCFMFVLLSNFSEHMLFVFCCFSDTCLRGTCFMFVLLTINIPRSFYFSEYENLTGAPNYWGPSFLGGVSQFGRRDSHFGCVT